MLVYIFATILSIGFAYFIKRTDYIDLSEVQLSVEYKNNIHNIFFMILSFLPLFIVAAIRWDVGTDFEKVYEYGFNLIIANGEQPRWEWGFSFLIKMIALFTDKCQWMFAGTAFVFCFFTYKAIYDSSKNICQSIFLLMITTFYFFSLNGIRQAIAIAIFLYSIKYIKQKKLLSYILVIFLASSFHTIALIFIPLYFICNIKIPPKKGIIIIAASFISAPFVGSIFQFIMSKTRYVSYFGSVYDVQDTPYVHILINTVITIIGYYCYNQNSNNRSYNIFMNIQLIGTIFTIFSGSILIAERIILTFESAQILFIPEILYSEDNVLIKNMIRIAVYSMFIFIMFYGTVKLGWYTVLPYKTFFT